MAFEILRFLTFNSFDPQEINFKFLCSLFINGPSKFPQNMSASVNKDLMFLNEDLTLLSKYLIILS